MHKEYTELCEALEKTVLDSNVTYRTAIHALSKVMYNFQRKGRNLLEHRKIQEVSNSGELR